MEEDQARSATSAARLATSPGNAPRQPVVQSEIAVKEEAIVKEEATVTEEAITVATVVVAKLATRAVEPVTCRVTAFKDPSATTAMESATWQRTALNRRKRLATNVAKKVISLVTARTRAPPPLNRIRS